MASTGSGILRADVLGAGSREDQGVSPRAALRWGFEMSLFTSKVKKKIHSAAPHTPWAAGAAGKEPGLPPGYSQSHTDAVKHARESCRCVWLPEFMVKSHWFGPIIKVVTLEAQLGTLEAKLGQTESLGVQRAAQTPLRAGAETPKPMGSPCRAELL